MTNRRDPTVEPAFGPTGRTVMVGSGGGCSNHDLDQTRAARMHGIAELIPEFIDGA